MIKFQYDTPETVIILNIKLDLPSVDLDFFFFGSHILLTVKKHFDVLCILILHRHESAVERLSKQTPLKTLSFVETEYKLDKKIGLSFSRFIFITIHT